VCLEHAMCITYAPDETAAKRGLFFLH
jgi:hypothetical protein